MVSITLVPVPQGVHENASHTGVSEEDSLPEAAIAFDTDPNGPDSMDNSDPVVDEPALWYKGSNGEFFLEHREPFFRFNLAVYVCAIIGFSALTFQFTVDFYAQRANPVTSSKLEINASQLFPGMLFCNLDRETPLAIVGASYYYNTSDMTNITGEMEPVFCNPDAQAQPTCYSLAGSNFTAFQTDMDGTCRSQYTLRVTFDPQLQFYSNGSLAHGVWVILHQPLKRDLVLKDWCNSVKSSCGNLADRTDTCSSDISDLAYEQLMASSGFLNSISLETVQRQFSPSCGQIVTKWNPNQFLARSTFGDQYVDLMFVISQPVIQVVTYSPISVLTFWGSLAGWFGALSDGWGLLSVLFCVERITAYVLDRYRRSRYRTATSKHQLAVH